MKNTIDMAQTREWFKLENIIIVKWGKWYLKLLVQVTKSNDGCLRGTVKVRIKNWRYAVAYQSILEKFVMCHLHQLVKISEYNVVHE
jgi:hypothetical protein